MDPRAWVQAAIRLTQRPDSPSDRGRIERVISMLDASLELLPPVDDARREGQIRLIEALMFLFEHTRDMAHLVRAVGLSKAYASQYPPAGSGHQTFLVVAANAALRYGDTVGGDRPVRAALRAARRGLEYYPQDPQLLAIYGNALALKYDQDGQRRTLDQAVQAHTSAVRLTQENDAEYAGRLSGLGVALSRKAKATADVRVALHAVAVQRHAVRAAGLEPIEARASTAPEVTVLHNLGSALLIEYEFTHEERILTEALARHRQAVKTSAALAYAKSIHFALGLADALYTQYEEYGDEAAFDEGLEVRHSVIANLPDGHPMKTPACSNAAGMWIRRYDRTAEYDSLHEAHRLINEVLAVTQPWDPALPHRRNLLGVILLRLAHAAAEATEQLTLLQEASECLRAAADAAGERPPAAMYRSNLAACLHSLFDSVVGTNPVAAQEALNEAIGLNRQAIAQTPQDGYERARYVGNLAATLTSKAKYLEDLDILDEARDACEGVLARLREQDSGRGRYLSLAGAICRTRFDLASDDEAARAAYAYYLQAAHEPTSAAVDRIHAAAEAGAAAGLYGDHHAGYAAMRDGLDLFDRALSPLLSHRDQERMLARLTALPRDAAAMAIAAGQFDTALDLVERGRSVLLNRMSAARSEYDRLAQQEPQLAEKLRQVQGVLDGAQEPAAAITSEEIEGQPPRLASPAAHSRIDLARQYEELLAEIRARPGLQDFLRPHLPHDLTEAGAHGPVIVVNISDLRCDALVVDRSGLVHVPLPGISARDVAERADAFVEACGKRATDASTEIVEWTWDRIAEPILNALGINAPADGQALPRIWWCPTGMAVFLPLHAAGRHRTAGQTLPRSVPDFTVPSYTATVSALLRLRALEPDPSPELARMLAIGVATSPFAPEAEPLQSVASDMDLIRQCFHTPTILEGKDALCAQVLENMARHSHVHFACHGQQDPASPFDGHLHMHDDRLSTRHIARQDIPDARFAFVSACETYLGGTDLPDEAVTVAAALHLAGYRDVIATHWQVNDSVAGLVAQAFYQRAILRDPDGNAIGMHEIADALRRAMLEVRAGGAPALYWGPFIHEGP